MKKAFLAAAALAAACLSPQAGAETPKTVVDRVDYEVCTMDGWTVRMNVAIGGALDGKPLKDIFGEVLKEIARDSTAAQFNTGRGILDRLLDKMDDAFRNAKTETPGTGYGFMNPRAGEPACVPSP